MSVSCPYSARPHGPLASVRTPQRGAHPGLDLVALGRHLESTGRIHRRHRRDPHAPEAA